MTLETRQGSKYIKKFFMKYPNTIQVKSETISTFTEMNKMSTWGKENLLFDALVTLENDYINNSPPKVVCMIWYLTNEIDAMAVKLRWT